MLIARVCRVTGLGLLLAVLAAGPFVRGLFFWTELLAGLGLVALGFICWAVGRRLEGLPVGFIDRSVGGASEGRGRWRWRGSGPVAEPAGAGTTEDQGGAGDARSRWAGFLASVPGGGPGLALLALLALYALQFAWAVYPRGNLDWTLRAGAAFLAYAMVRAEAWPSLRRWLGWVFVLSAAGVGLLGFAEYTGYLARNAELAKALSLVGLSDRMFTSFQYPNTAAAYFLAAMLAAAGLSLEDLKPWKMALSGAFATFLTLAFFFTVSRGAVVVLPFGLVLFFLGLERGRRWPALLLLAVAFAGLAGSMNRIGLFSAARNWVSAFRWIGAATAGGAVAGLVLAYFLQLKRRWQTLLAGLGLVAAVAGFIALRPAGPVLPKQATRLLDMNFGTVNVALRLTYDQDAVKMAADRPLGRGGWGWDRGYRQYQSFNYTARETHDQYAQTAVEAGWPGLAALLAALGAGLWAAWRSRKGNPLGWSLAAGATLIAGHAAIDFDLSFGVMWLLLWTLLAAGAGQAPALAPGADPAAADDATALAPATATALAPAPAPAPATALAPAPAEPRLARAWFWGTTALAAAIAVAAGPLFLGALYLDRGDYRQAARFDPLQSEPLLQLGDRDSLEKAARLDPYHSGIRFKLAIARELQKDYTGAMTEARAALEAQPQVSAYYTKAAELTGKLMVDALHDGRLDEARAYSADLVRMGQAFASRKTTGDALQNLWKAGPKLEMAPSFQLRYGQALFLQGDVAGAEPLLAEAGKVGLLGSEAHVWLYVIYEKRGDTKAMGQLADKPWIRFKDQNPVYKALKAWQPG
jgi:O-antigen ligase